MSPRNANRSASNAPIAPVRIDRRERDTCAGPASTPTEREKSRAAAARVAPRDRDRRGVRKTRARGISVVGYARNARPNGWSGRSRRAGRRLPQSKSDGEQPNRCWRGVDGNVCAVTCIQCLESGSNRCPSPPPNLPLSATSNSRVASRTRILPRSRRSCVATTRACFASARAILKDDAEAEDALQEAYLAAYSHIGGFRADATLATWLTRIVINEALGRLRRRKRDGVVVPFAAGTRDDQGEEVTILPDDMFGTPGNLRHARGVAPPAGTSDRRAAAGVSHGVHPARSRGVDGRGNGAMPVDSAGDGAHPPVSGARVVARFAIARTGLGLRRCIRLRRRALRSHRCRRPDALARLASYQRNDSALRELAVWLKGRPGTPRPRRHPMGVGHQPIHRGDEP